MLLEEWDCALSPWTALEEVILSLLCLSLSNEKMSLAFFIERYLIQRQQQQS